MTKPDLQVNFRMPADLKAQLEEAARQNNRSTTAEIVARLQESFEPRSESEGRATVLELKALMAEISLVSALLTMVQQQPPTKERDAVLAQLINRVDGLGDIPKMVGDLIRALPIEKPAELAIDQFSLEKRGNTPSPTSNKPTRKPAK